MVRKCEVCGAFRSHLLLEGQIHRYFEEENERVWVYDLAKCEGCGLVFIDPKPTWDLLQTFYDSDYGSYDPTHAAPEVEASSLKYVLASWRHPSCAPIGLIGRIQQLIAVISEWLSGKTISYSLAVPFTLPKNAHIFELGYGTGNWLLAMSQLGYQNLYGYDIDTNSENAERLKVAGSDWWGKWAMKRPSWAVFVLIRCHFEAENGAAALPNSSF